MRRFVLLLVVVFLSAACGGANGGDDTWSAPDFVDALEATTDVCVPDCTGKECGDDGCGGLCAEALPYDVVCFDGRLCSPICKGADIECGDDGCGGSCGSCGAGLICSFAHTCTTAPCAGVSAAGCCNGATVAFCQNGELGTQFCDVAGGEVCGWNASFGAYDCGASADADPSGAYPLACADVCVPDCSGRACGDDGCGGSCGACGGSTVCEPASGTCTTCLPDCTDRECGDDGCGGSCGACVGVLAYCAGGACQCSPQCAGRICGDDGCGKTCGDCEAGFTCVDGGCECAKQCDGKQCGPDGCGGLCGDCEGGCACGADGVCVPPGQSALQNACDGTVKDPATGLVWQQAFGGSRNFQDAKTLCFNLATAAHDDWRLPTIDELRSLIVGCPATAAGGPCPIHDGCTSLSCSGPACEGCVTGDGPGPDGSYLDAAFEPDLQTSFWSVTQIAATENPAFVVEFDRARVHWYVTSVTKMGVRCVRGPDAN